MTTRRTIAEFTIQGGGQSYWDGQRRVPVQGDSIIGVYEQDGFKVVESDKTTGLTIKGPIDCPTLSDALILALHNGGFSYTADWDEYGFQDLIPMEDIIVEVFPR